MPWNSRQKLRQPQRRLPEGLLKRDRKEAGNGLLVLSAENADNVLNEENARIKLKNRLLFLLVSDQNRYDYTTAVGRT